MTSPTQFSAPPLSPSLQPGLQALGYTDMTPIKAQALPIKAQSVVSRVMPLGNLTEMTDAERDLIGRWVNQGAKVE